MRKFFVVLSLIVVLAISGSALAADKVYTWKLQTVDDPGLMEYKEISVYFADRVRALSNGRLDIQIFPPGGLVASFEVWDALRRGVMQMSQHYLVYWQGKEPALRSAQEWPVMVDPLQGLIWLYEGGGIDFMNRVLDRHGLVYIGATPMEGEQIWSKKPLNSVADLKGLKIRAAGLAADSFALLGASVVTIPGGEIYQALERGVIDATEFTFPTVNYAYGFHEVTNYMVFPTYSGGGFYDWLVNKKAWEELPDDLKLIVDTVIKETTLRYWLKVRLETQRVIKILEDKGMKFIHWTKQDMDTLEKARVQAMKNYGRDSAIFVEKMDSMMKIMYELGYEEKK